MAQWFTRLNFRRAKTLTGKERVLAQLAVDECNELYCELVRRIRQLAEKEE